MIRFGEWLPDIPALENPGALTAQNVIPFPGWYGPYNSLSVYTNALTAKCRGAAAAVDGSGNTFVFAGDVNKLYRLSNATWSDVSKAGAPAYSLGADSRWNFSRFRDYMIATSFDDSVQGWLLGTDSAFSDLGTNTPKAKYVGSVANNFVVLGYTNDAGDGTVANRVWWSPINAPAGDYTADVDTQAGNEDLSDGLEITGIVSGEVALIFCKEAVYRMAYIGQPTLMQFDRLENLRGCVAPGSLTGLGGFAFYLSEDGFYMTDGINSHPIGENKVDEFFLSDALSGAFDTMFSTIDPSRNLYMVAYEGTGATSGTPNKILVYNWKAQRWSIVEEETEAVARLLTPGYTLEALDNISSSIDAFPSSLDSREWSGGAIIFGGFDSAHKFGLFGGDAKEATLQTAERQLGADSPEENKISATPGVRSFLAGVRPLTDAASPTVKVGYRDLQNGTIMWSGSSTPHAETGIAPFRVDARYHRIELTVPSAATWSYAQGIDIDAEPSTFR